MEQERIGDSRMTVKCLLFSSLFVLVSFNLNWNSTEVFGNPESSGLDSPQSSAPIRLTLDKGTLQLKTSLGTVLSSMKLRLNYGDNLSLLYDLEPAGRDKAADKTGSYERLRYGLKL